MIDTSSLWPSQEHKTDFWGMVAGKLCRRYGLPIDYQLPHSLLVGIRGVAPYSPISHDLVSRPAYDDTFVLFADDGLIPATVFPGSTHAYQARSAASPDVNHDGVGDVGTIKPGAFWLAYAGGRYPTFTVTTYPDGSGRIPCYRDLNHDGVPEDGDWTADSILVHWGYNAPADSDHRSSIGCQTMDGQWLRLLQHRAERCGGKVLYVLETVEQIMRLIRSDTDPAPPPTEVA